MELQGIAKRMIGFQQGVFNNNYYGFTVIQDFSHNVMRGYLQQFPGYADNSRKTFSESFEFIKKTHQGYKKTVDQGFSTLEELVCIKEKISQSNDKSSLGPEVEQEVVLQKTPPITAGKPTVPAQHPEPGIESQSPVSKAKQSPAPKRCPVGVKGKSVAARRTSKTATEATSDTIPVALKRPAVKKQVTAGKAIKKAPVSIQTTKNELLLLTCSE